MNWRSEGCRSEPSLPGEGSFVTAKVGRLPGPLWDWRVTIFRGSPWCWCWERQVGNSASDYWAKCYGPSLSSCCWFGQLRPRYEEALCSLGSPGLSAPCRSRCGVWSWPSHPAGTPPHSEPSRAPGPHSRTPPPPARQGQRGTRACHTRISQSCCGPDFVAWPGMALGRMLHFSVSFIPSNGKWGSWDFLHKVA